MEKLRRVPILILLTGVGGIAMMVPAMHALVIRDHAVARNFFYSGLLTLILAAILALATGANPVAGRARGALVTLMGTFTILPLVLAVPFSESVPDTGLYNSWWEMVSSLTTTGATLFDAELLPPSLHVWRALVGWMGGFFILVAAIAIMAPWRVGGFELTAAPDERQEYRDHLPKPDGGSGWRKLASRADHIARMSDPAQRALRHAGAIMPYYIGFTMLLWVLLLMLGDPSLVAFCRALGTISTSGISPLNGAVGRSAGTPGEVVVFLFLCLALTRRFWPGGNELRTSDRLLRDPELRMAAFLVLLVTAVLALRHFTDLIDTADPQGPSTVAIGFFAWVQQFIRAVWGGMFNALSYLTTTGWNSVAWEDARLWSGLSSPGLILAGLALMGGGVATTAGGVKLLRVYSLARHGEREMVRIIHPTAVMGGGRIERRLRREGAYLSFIFFMVFAISIAAVVVLVSISRLNIETATILSVSALTNTGPLAGTIPLIPTFEGSAGVAGAPWAGWAGLSMLTKGVLAVAMVVGRLELLAILVLFNPDFWRR
ncbi:potassium transporter TrkG [Paracoccus pacificus]|uniref:Potassium transporter TrkG n=1 Tax=Paracoccus pacificus TaxID=1463598 RepID=A0ABW4RB39_9RHOB